MSLAVLQRDELERIVRGDVHIMKVLVAARDLDLPQRRVVDHHRAVGRGVGMRVGPVRNRRGKLAVSRRR